MAASDIVIQERADIEVRTETGTPATVDLTGLENRLESELENQPAGLSLVERHAVPDATTDSEDPRSTADSGTEADDSDEDEDDDLDDDAPIRAGTVIEIAALTEAGSDVLPPELAWQERALCAQTDPEAFFPEKGGSTREAKRVCMSCEVRAECLDYALAKDERFGIWGGLSERERRRVKKQAV
jgi:WhiB family redox-sensing transcriptional regulator